MNNLKPKDVVRILHSQCKRETGIVNRIDSVTGMVSVFRKKYSGFATWFFRHDLKRIGSTQRRKV